jgi:hypothetical protein
MPLIKQMNLCAYVFSILLAIKINLIASALVYSFMLDKNAYDKSNSNVKGPVRGILQISPLKTLILIN